MTGADRWRASALMREAIRNFGTSRRRLVPLIYLAAVGGIAIAAIAALDGLSLNRDLTALGKEGRNVVVFTSATETPTVIGRASCEKLSDFENVERSGLILTSTRMEVVPLGASVPVIAASATLFPGLREGTAVIGVDLTVPDAARRVSIAGSVVPTTRGTRQPAGLPTNQALVVTALPSVKSSDRCIALLTPGTDARLNIPILKASLDVSGGPSTGSAVLTEPLDRVDAHFQRLTVWLPLALGVFGGLATLSIALTRSNEFAAYRLSGTSARSLFLICAFECVVAAGVMVFTTTIFASALQPLVLSLRSTILASVGGAGIWLLVSFAGLTFLTRQSVLTISKER